MECKVIFESSNKYLQFSDENESSFIEGILKFSPQTGIIRIQFDFRISQNGMQAYLFRVWDGTWKAIQVQEGTDGKLCNSDISINVFHNVKIELNTVTDKYDIYLDNELKAKDVAFMNVRDQITGIGFGTNNGGHKGTIYLGIDNIQVTKL